jgi:hypothetical protein
MNKDENYLKCSQGFEKKIFHTGEHLEVFCMLIPWVINDKHIEGFIEFAVNYSYMLT